MRFWTFAKDIADAQSNRVYRLFAKPESLVLPSNNLKYLNFFMDKEIRTCLPGANIRPKAACLSSKKTPQHNMHLGYRQKAAADRNQKLTSQVPSF
jgi:hypothetical protein